MQPDERAAEPSPAQAPAPSALGAARPAASAPWLLALAVLLALLAVALAWQSQSRLARLEQELVRRQAGSQSQAESALAAARQAEDQVRALAAQMALAQAKLDEAALQRRELDALMTALSRSRDEHAVTDLEASLRVALQQATLTGSSEPLLMALRQGEERLQRLAQPRLEPLRRALQRDLDRVKAASGIDGVMLAQRLDEATRAVDELALLSEPQRRRGEAPPAAAPEAEPQGTAARWQHWLGLRVQQVWDETRGLLRVTRIEHPSAMLVSPEQSFFLRENLKLRLLNARLALLSRQHETARADLEAVLALLERHADARDRRTQQLRDSVRQVLTHARPQALPRPDDSLAALASLGAVR